MNKDSIVNNICGVVGKGHRQKFEKLSAYLNENSYGAISQCSLTNCTIGTHVTSEYNKKITHNPISVEDVTITVAGYISNKKEMGYTRDISTGQIVLNLYIAGDLDRLKNANGSYNFVVWDNNIKKLTIGNDRHGSRRLFYRYAKNEFSFSSSVIGLAKIHPTQTLDKDSMLDMMVFGYILNNRTLLNEIMLLPYATIMEFDGTETSLQKYWDWEFNDDQEQSSEDELEEELVRLLIQAVERNLIHTSGNILLPLSGGLDSRALLGVCSQLNMQHKISTITYGRKESFDLEIGSALAKIAGVSHIDLLPERDNFPDNFKIEVQNVEGMIEATPFYPAFQYLKLNHDFHSVISGQVGGSLFDSVSTKFSSNLKNSKDLLSKNNMCLQHHALHDLDFSRNILQSDISDEQFFKRSGIDNISNLTSDNDIKRAMKYWTCSKRLFYYTPFCNCRFNHLFNYLSPFLDKDLVDFAMKLPLEKLNQQFLYRKALLKWQPDLFNLPTSRRSGLSLSESNLQYYLRRAKIKAFDKLNTFSTRLVKRNISSCKTDKYISYDNLLRTNSKFRNSVYELLCGVKNKNLCNASYLDNLWNQHLTGKANHYRVFSVLLTFEIFSMNLSD